MRFFKTVMSLLVGRAGGSFLYTLALILIARWTDLASFGRVSGLIGASVFIAFFFDLGLTLFILRERAVRADDETGEILTALHIAKYTSALAGLVTFLVGIAIGVPLLPAALIAVGTCLDKFTENWSSVMIAEARNGMVSVVLVERRVILIGMMFALHAAGVDGGVAFGVSLVVGAVVAQIHRPSALANLRSERSKNARDVVRRSRSFWVALVSTQTKELEGVTVLAVASAHVGGVYSVGARLARPMLLFSATIANVLLPHLASRGATHARRTANILGWIGVGYVIVSACLSPLVPWVIRLLLGSGFDDAYASAMIQVVAIGPIALCSSFGSVLQAQGHEKFVATNGVIYSVLSIGGLVVGVLIGGAFGGALAIAVAMTLKFATLWRASLRYITVDEPVVASESGVAETR